MLCLCKAYRLIAKQFKAMLGEKENNTKLMIEMKQALEREIIVELVDSGDCCDAFETGKLSFWLFNSDRIFFLHFNFYKIFKV